MASGTNFKRRPAFVCASGNVLNVVRENYFAVRKHFKRRPEFVSASGNILNAVRNILSPSGNI